MNINGADLHLVKERLERRIGDINEHIAIILKFSSNPSSSVTQSKIQSLKFTRGEYESMLSVINFALKNRFPRP